MMIPEEEYPPSKSVTDTSQMQESKANNNISDMDLLREFEKQDPDDAKRRTQ